MIDYSPLWDTMARQGVTQYQILKDKVIDNKTLDSLKKGKNITMLTAERICKYLKCTPNDIVEFKD
ncbi:MAG: helix-turn-helix domain-containing protein [Clostridia bacterium]|nr:helix-turn-helix domain-containing protein [Clostridia bacterium]